MRIKSTMTKTPKTAQRLKIATSAEFEDYAIAHAFVADLIGKRRLPLKENTVSYLASRAVFAYREKGESAMQEEVKNALWTILNGIDDGKRAKVYNVCEVKEVKNVDILAVLRGYFTTMFGEDVLENDHKYFYLFIPSAFDMEIVRRNVESILRGNSL
jgi:hypothetical protein